MTDRKDPLSIVRSSASFALLLLFIWGVGSEAFFPSARAFQDIHWDFSFFFPTWCKRAFALLLLLPLGVGFVGWGRIFRELFFRAFETNVANFFGVSLGVSAFSFYVLALGLNGIIYWSLTALFFVPALWAGWVELKQKQFWKKSAKWAPISWLAVLPVSLWLFEFLSPPLVWDAILDHFRYAREVSRIHQIPLYWVNHTGDMPKAAELILAGLWNLGGEALSKFGLLMPVLLTLWLFDLFVEGERRIAQWIFLTCPYFLAIYAFGYVEGFLAFFEGVAFFCLWKSLAGPNRFRWLVCGSFFLGFAGTVKYTAVLAVLTVVLVAVYEIGVERKRIGGSLLCLLVFVIPCIPWAVKSILAFDNPFYPLATSLFRSPIGYSPQMESGLLTDTGVPWAAGLAQVPITLCRSFFTAENAVNAPWTPLLIMALPWAGFVLKTKLGRVLALVAFVYLGGWLLISSSFRHASGGALVLALLTVLAWKVIFQSKATGAKPLFVAGVLVSLWLVFATQFSTTTPYATALGLEDPHVPLGLNFSYSMDVFEAYRVIEAQSDPSDKVMAFAVWQTYPLDRTSFVDFKWKKPIFYDWVSHCRTAEQVAEKFHQEGVRYFLLQKKEAEAMSKAERDFRIEGISPDEYKRFWAQFLEPVWVRDNVSVYRVRWTETT